MTDTTLYAKTASNLATDVAALGTTNPMTLVIKEGATGVATALTGGNSFPANLQLKFERGGRLVKSASGAINFLGNPFKNHQPPPGIFENFAPGEITFADPPPVIYAEWWNTNNSSLPDRINRADQSVVLSKKIKIVCAPRNVDKQMKVRYNRRYVFTPGDYQYTLTGAAPPEVSSYRTEPFIYYVPENELLVMEWEPGAVFLIGTSVDHKQLLMPDDEMHPGLSGRIHLIRPHLKGTPVIANSGGRAVILTGNCQDFLCEGGRFEGTQDYFTMGGDPRNGNYAKKVKFKGLYVLNQYNYVWHGLNSEDGLFEDCLLEVLGSLPGARTTATGDDEPNNPEEILRGQTYRRCGFRTDQATAVPGNPDRAFDYYQQQCFTSQAAATDGIYNQTYEDCWFESPKNDFAGVQAAIYAEGHFNLKIHRFRQRGGSVNGLYRIDRSDKTEILNPDVSDGYSGKIRLYGCARTTIKIDENRVTNPNDKVILENEWGFPVLVNGDDWRMLEDWTSVYGRVYKFMADNGWKFDLNNAVHTCDGYTSTKNVSNYRHKRLSSGTSIATKSTIPMTSISGAVITHNSHGLTRGEPLDYNSTGTMFTQLKDLWYASELTPVGEKRRVYAIPLTANTFSLAKTMDEAFAGTAISGFTGGSGTHTLQPFQLTVKSFLPTDVDIDNNRVLVPGHNLVKGAPVQYRNVGAEAIGGLFEAEIPGIKQSIRTVDGIAENWYGYYWVYPDPSDANYLKFTETKEDALNETNPIDLNDIGQGYHVILPVALTDNSDSNRYDIPADYTVYKRNPLSRSKVVKHFADADEDNLTNFALASEGATVTASSTDADNYQASRAIDGLRHGAGHWGSDTGIGKAWKSDDAVSVNGFEWLEINFGQLRAIKKVNVFFPANGGYDTSTEPDLDETSDNWAATAYQIQAYYNGAWETLFSVTGNNKRRKEHALTAPFYTTKIRIYITGTPFSNATEAAVQELEALG